MSIRPLKYIFISCVFAAFIFMIGSIINTNVTFKTYRWTMNIRSSNLQIEERLHKLRIKILNSLSFSNKSRIDIKSTTITSTNLTTKQTLNVNKTSLVTEISQKPFLVPNVVHYVFLSPKKYFRFHEMLGILSASMFLKPEVINFHCDIEPTGSLWLFIKTKVKNLKIIKITKKVSLFNVVPDFPETKSDMLRMSILKEQGGIYLDFDVIVIRSFDDLRKYEFTMGIEYRGNPGRLNNGIIISAPNARFLDKWIDTYKSFRHNEWDYHSCQVPYLLHLKFPNLIHVEEKTINYPSGLMLHLIYFELYDWRQNYAVHLWFRLYLMNRKYREVNFVTIRTMNTTLGQLARRILYNTTELLR